MNVDWLRSVGIVCDSLPFIAGKFSFEKPIRLYKDVAIRHSHFGAYSYVSLATDVNYCTIGRYTSIGANCMLGPSKHDMSAFTTSPVLQKNVFQIKNGPSGQPLMHDFDPIIIGNDVWIGSDACIMGGVKIGDGAVVGYGSIVTKDVPPFAVVAGSPAKIIKYRFDEATVRDFLNFQWWRLDIPDAHYRKTFPEHASAQDSLEFMKEAESDGRLRPISPRRKRFAKEDGRLALLDFDLAALSA